MKPLALLLAGLLLLSFAPAAAANDAPAVTTDKPVYAPGEVVTLRGEGWAPGEPVSIVIAAEGGGATTLRATADSSGAFTLTATMPDEDAPKSAGRSPVRIAAASA
ncbi:MAG TPA: hypothetical protein VKB93_29000, partial [Thermoanaerobaculia bacterium]|nr:hypothetical protein [Thermoanaerobaculia bacterium]